MSMPRTERFRQIIEAARKRDGLAGIDTLVVSSHLAQMRMFMLRQGIEFYPAQDTYGFRKTFLAQLIADNEIDARLEGVIDDFLIDGKGLWYFRPIGESYRILWFSKDHYRAYYDAAGELEELELIYSFQVRGTNPGLMPVMGEQGSLRWVKLKVRRDALTETITAEKPSFESGFEAMAPRMGTTRTVTNSLGFIPAVESFNNMRSTGMEATGDFDWLAEHIVVHDELVKNIRANIHFYGNPTLVSSRPKHDLVEAGGEEDLRPTISSQAGFYAASRPSTRVSAPTGSGGLGGMKVPRIIANVEATDRVLYITPDAVSGDQNLYARQYREEIRNALGGVDELGISTGATAYEIKSLYGRAATTASRKCRGLLTYGLCKLMALVVLHEERIFRESFAQASGMPQPEVPLREQFDTSEEFQAAVEAFEGAYNKWFQQLENAIGEAVRSEQLPPGVVGLIPDGDRRIEWRWKGPVFEDSTEDILNSSIVVRNLQELGVNSIEALRYLFPDKTDEERSAMLSGYPFRMAQATQASIGTYLQLLQTMQQTPHPQAPDLPMLADPRLDLTPYVYRALDFLKRELTYAGQYNDAAGSSEPAQLDPIERGRANRGLPASSGPERPSFRPDGSGGFTGAAGPAGQSMAGGVQQPDREPDFGAQLPTPGALMGSEPTGQLGAGFAAGTNGLPAGNAGGFSFGDADLLAPSNTGLQPGASPEPERRRVSTKRQQRKS